MRKLKYVKLFENFDDINKTFTESEKEILKNNDFKLFTGWAEYGEGTIHKAVNNRKGYETGGSSGTGLAGSFDKLEDAINHIKKIVD
jgi:hypothetical protein